MLSVVPVLKCNTYKQEERINPEIYLQPQVMHFVEFLYKTWVSRVLAALYWKGYELWNRVHSDLNVGTQNMTFSFL